MNDESLGAAAALDDPLRRRIYQLVRTSGRPLSRQEVAAEASVSRKLATFHLERLLSVGLLQAHYERPSGRRGPGAGRTAKYYRPSDSLVELIIPVRQYQRAARILARALDARSRDETALDATRRVARDIGLRIGQTTPHRGHSRQTGRRALAVAEDVLARQGYEPYRRERNGLALRNCVFEALAMEHRELVCTMNLSLVEGMLEGADCHLESALLPTPGECCVLVLAPRT